VHGRLLVQWRCRIPLWSQNKHAADYIRSSADNRLVRDTRQFEPCCISPRSRQRT
jgi:hypothetical protein